MNAFENDLDPSILAARALGPNTGIPTDRRPSTTMDKMGISHTFSKVGLDAID